MKKFLSVMAFLALLSLSQGCAMQGENPEQAIAAVKALDARYTAAFSKGDLDGVMAEYWKSPELVVYPPDAPEGKGWDNVKAGFGNFMKNAPGAKLEITEATYTLKGDSVLAWGRWKMSFPAVKDGPVMMGRFTEVAMKKEGKWVLVHDHPSLPMQPPAK